MGLAVFVAAALAHDRTSLQTFWNKEAVLKRSWPLAQIPLGPALDSFTSKINKIFVRGGWIVAGFIIILVQAFYICLVMAKRDRVPTLQFIRHFDWKRMVAIELGVLVTGTVYFLICTWSFNQIAKGTGSCESPTGSFSFPTSPTSCRPPAVFRGFDISGHCFLIVHSCLLALEYAAKVLFVWRSREQFGNSSVFNDKDSDLESVKEKEEEEDNETARETDWERSLKSNNFFNRNHKTFQFILVTVLTLVFLLCALELLVFMQTILFYHTVLEKVLGTIIGATFWAGLFLLSLKYPHLF